MLVTPIKGCHLFGCVQLNWLHLIAFGTKVWVHSDCILHSGIIAMTQWIGFKHKFAALHAGRSSSINFACIRVAPPYCTHRCTVHICGMNSQGGVTQMQAKWNKLDLHYMHAETKGTSLTQSVADVPSDKL